MSGVELKKERERETVFQQGKYIYIYMYCMSEAMMTRNEAAWVRVRCCVRGKQR